MNTDKTNGLPRPHLIYLGVHFSSYELGQLYRACGILPMDVTAHPKPEEIKQAIRDLVHEAIASRIKRLKRRDKNDDSVKGDSTGSKMP